MWASPALHAVLFLVLYHRGLFSTGSPLYGASLTAQAIHSPTHIEARQTRNEVQGLLY